MALQHETSDNRREILKKVGTFAVPAVATFTLSEMKVRASGIGTGSIDQAWDSFWTPDKTEWLTKPKSFWEGDKDFWWLIWNRV